MRIAPRIHRLGNGIANSYLVEEGGEVTIIDAGVPSYWGDLPAELEAMGRRLEDLRAIVLTHGHTDHIGFAERARTERGLPVSVHELDAALARGEVPNPAKMGRTRFVPLLRFLLFAMGHGALRTKHLGEVATYGDGATLDVPGSPRVILVPGHTPGSAVSPRPIARRALHGRRDRDAGRHDRRNRADDRAVHGGPGGGPRVAAPARRDRGRLAAAGPRPAVDGRSGGGPRTGAGRGRRLMRTGPLGRTSRPASPVHVPNAKPWGQGLTAFQFS